MYEYLLNFADDRTLLNMLQVNHRFAEKLNDNFFKKIMERRYPLLIKFKFEEETGKHLYLRMMKYIALLEEKYGIPYIPQSEYNPNHFYSFMNNYSSMILNQALIYAVKTGDLDIVKKIVEKGADKFINSLDIAAENNYLNIIEYLWSSWKRKTLETISQIAETASYIAAVAARSNNTDIVKYMLDEGATNFNKILVYTAEGGHLEIVKKILELGATDIQSALEYARIIEQNEEERARKREVVRYLENYRIN